MDLYVSNFVTSVSYLSLASVQGIPLPKLKPLLERQHEMGAGKGLYSWSDYTCSITSNSTAVIKVCNNSLYLECL